MVWCFRRGNWRGIYRNGQICRKRHLIVQDQMEQQMEHERETGVYIGVI